MFLNHIHENRFNELAESIDLKDYDVERRAFLYIISSCDEIFEIKDQVYDFQEDFPRFIDFEELSIHPIFQRLLYIAFSIYNGYNPDNFSIIELFGHFDEYTFNVAINAIKIRFNKSI